MVRQCFSFSLVPLLSIYVDHRLRYYLPLIYHVLFVVVVGFFLLLFFSVFRQNVLINIHEYANELILHI